MQVLTNWPAKAPEEALKQVYDTNYTWLLQYVQQHSGNAADADDIFQESLFAAWVNLREGRFSGNMEQFKAYFRKICKYKWINYLNTANRKRVNLRDDFSQIEYAEEESLPTGEINDDSATLRKSFARLGEKCRKVLGLFYYKRESMAKIAEITGDTEASIKTIKYRCMQQLRTLYLENRANGEQQK